MRREDLNVLIKKTFEEVLSLSTNKGHEYSGEDDALSNFKRNAERVGITPMQVWAVFAGKHYDSICTYIKESTGIKKRKLAEPIESRIDDLITYLLLLKGLVYEKEGIEVGPHDAIEVDKQYAPNYNELLQKGVKGT